MTQTVRSPTEASAVSTNAATGDRLGRRPLAREITAILLIKLVLILIIWLTWFRNPIDRELDAAAMSAVLLNSTTPRAPQGLQ